MSAGAFSPLEGEMAAQRPEGVQAGVRRHSAGAGAWAVPSEETPSAAFGGTSPSRGEERPS